MDRTQVLINAGGGAAEERTGALPFDFQLIQGAVSPSDEGCGDLCRTGLWEVGGE